LHDAVAGEKLNIPSIGVMTAGFVHAAELMARVLGADGYRFVTIEHPISSASTQQLAERAATAVQDSAGILIGETAGLG